MKSLSPELADFLATATKVAATVSESSEAISTHARTLSETGILDLAGEIEDEPDELSWLAHTVRVTAQSSPSLAFTLAGRYVADAIGRDCGKNGAAFALSFDGAATVASTALPSDRVVVWDSETNSINVAPWAETKVDAGQRRSGLVAAKLVSVTMPAEARRSDIDPTHVIARWDVLTGAALVGAAQRAVRETETYVMARHQFGVPVGSFAGLRALVAGMELAASEAEALLVQAIVGDVPSSGVSATAGRSAVAVCIDAVQAHGGYGYIDEYPLAGLLRDAISLQARAGGRRFHIARIAQRGLGVQGRVLP